MSDFHELCTQCGACARACPTNIISRDGDGFPVINLAAGACLFCTQCAAACEAEAIVPASGWGMRAQVAASCLSLNGVMCRTCEDHCDARAIRFRLERGGRSTPVFDLDACTGCGACIGPCPAGAIQLVHPQPRREETPC
ncbi:MAG: ferredoxin-type protein NapF [Maritimibacter sp.]